MDSERSRLEDPCVRVCVCASVRVNPGEEEM